MSSIKGTLLVAVGRCILAKTEEIGTGSNGAQKKEARQNIRLKKASYIPTVPRLVSMLGEGGEKRKQELAPITSPESHT